MAIVSEVGEDWHMIVEVIKRDQSIVVIKDKMFQLQSIG